MVCGAAGTPGNNSVAFARVRSNSIEFAWGFVSHSQYVQGAHGVEVEFARSFVSRSHYVLGARGLQREMLGNVYRAEWK